ncbi:MULTISPECIES: helix-turn-helix transcriptional regulator [unclassified Streptomyces]|uniref:helix-turn-helix transcriptional regulator n=1 Tax=unclassified Streptomyces TaxID=2593676 RepID=UPI001F0DAAFC|nr:MULTISPECIES: helix-turn-helix transcriptional regulator [unclassified Streptomyces]
MASTAILSKFYFSRVFRDLTGTSPGRFLSAVRVHSAKSLLLETQLSVTDISYKVGYNSLGTFTSRFTWSVGVSPTRYRTLANVGIPILPTGLSAPRTDNCPTSVHGSVSVPRTELPTRVYVAAFKDPIVQGAPAACDILDSPREYHLDGLPDGRWYLRAAVVAKDGIDPRPWNRQPLFIGASEPVTVRSGRPLEVDLRTREFRPFDLPILLALPELDSWQVPQYEMAAPGAV